MIGTRAHRTHGRFAQFRYRWRLRSATRHTGRDLVPEDRRSWLQRSAATNALIHSLLMAADFFRKSDRRAATLSAAHADAREAKRLLNAARADLADVVACRDGLVDGLAAPPTEQASAIRDEHIASESVTTPPFQGTHRQVSTHEAERERIRATVLSRGVGRVTYEAGRWILRAAEVAGVSSAMAVLNAHPLEMIILAVGYGWALAATGEAAGATLKDHRLELELAECSGATESPRFTAVRTAKLVAAAVGIMTLAIAVGVMRSLSLAHQQARSSTVAIPGVPTILFVLMVLAVPIAAALNEYRWHNPLADAEDALTRRQRRIEKRVNGLDRKLGERRTRLATAGSRFAHVQEFYKVHVDVWRTVGEENVSLIASYLPDVHGTTAPKDDLTTYHAVPIRATVPSVVPAEIALERIVGRAVTSHPGSHGPELATNDGTDHEHQPGERERVTTGSNGHRPHRSQADD